VLNAFYKSTNFVWFVCLATIVDLSEGEWHA